MKPPNALFWNAVLTLALAAYGLAAVIALSAHG